MQEKLAAKQRISEKNYAKITRTVVPNPQFVDQSWTVQEVGTHNHSPAAVTTGPQSQMF